MRRSVIAAIVLCVVASPVAAQKKDRNVAACTNAELPLVLISDEWLPREGGSRFALGSSEWEKLEKAAKFLGTKSQVVELRPNDRGIVKIPDESFRTGTFSMVHAYFDQNLQANEFDTGAKFVRSVVEVVRKWACNAPAVRVAATGVAGMHVRAYLQSELYQGDIRQFIGVGVPHGGAVLEAALKSISSKDVSSCLGQLELSTALTDKSRDVERYFAALSAANPQRDSLNRAIGRYRAIPSAVDVVEILVDADSLKARTANCSRIWSRANGPDDGISPVTWQQIPPSAFADFRSAATKQAVGGTSAAMLATSGSVASAIYRAISRPVPSAVRQYVVADSHFVLTNKRGAIEGAEEEFFSATLTLRRRLGCDTPECKLSDTVIVFSGNKAQEPLRLARFESVRRITLPVYSTRTNYARRPTLHALLIEHFRGPTIVVSDESGRIGKVELRPGAFPNGVRAVRGDSLCIQGDERIESNGGSIGTVRFLSTLRYCSLVQASASSPLAPRSPVGVPPLLSWQQDVAEVAKDEVRKESGVRVFEASSGGDQNRNDRFVVLATPGDTIRALGSGALFLRLTYSSARDAAAVVDLGFTGDKMGLVWNALVRVNRDVWTLDEKSPPPAGWDPEDKIQYPVETTHFYRVDMSSLRQADGKPMNAGDVYRQLLLKVAKWSGRLEVFAVYK